jgi:hypothetical protein
LADAATIIWLTMLLAVAATTAVLKVVNGRGAPVTRDQSPEGALADLAGFDLVIQVDEFSRPRRLGVSTRLPFYGCCRGFM